LETPALFRRVPWKARRAKAEELLKRIGAEISPTSEVRELSMPEQQLVEIAAAIAAGARVVIMDEPTASLTQKEQHLLFAVARELRASGVGIIYISHRLEEIFALADRVTVLRDGQSVGTNRIDAVNETELIRMMVGREITQVYPESGGCAGEVVLETRQLGCVASGLRNVSFQLRRGEIFGFAGLVGAGRTELARALFGIAPADSGEILLRGCAARIISPQDAIAHGIAYVPEDRSRHGVILEMPLSANVTLASLPRFWMNFTRERSVTEEFVGRLAVKASGVDALAGSLSGGNQQKISLARWLATNPKILILDEPTQGVDVGAKAEIHKIIRSLAANGIAILMISSDLPEIIGMSDRIAVMRGGTIAATLPGKSSAHDVMTAALGVRAE
jgi:rhamnose transport system ATP-binding protein